MHSALPVPFPIRLHRAGGAIALLVGCAGTEMQPRDEVRSMGWPIERRASLATGIVARWIELGNPAGEVVLFLHGYTDTSRSFSPTMEYLAGMRPDLRLIAMDQRGHGGSSLPAGPGCPGDPGRCFRPADFAADAFALLDHAGIARAHLVGHSLGSMVAQEMALVGPERVGRIVLIGTTAKAGGNPLTEEFLQAGLVEGPWKEALEARGLRFPEDAWQRTPLDVDPEAEGWLAQNWATELGADPALLAAIVPETARIPLGTWIGVLRGLEEHDNRERLGDLRTPTLVLWPIQDVFFHEDPDQRDLRTALERASARHGTPWAWKCYGREPRTDSALPQTDLGHNLQWVAPEAVARDLAGFLREDGAPTRDLAFLAGGEAPRVEIEPGKARVLGGGARARGTER